VNPDFVEGPFHVIQFEWFYDRLDFFQGPMTPLQIR
jgi:hypothetical protein